MRRRPRRVWVMYDERARPDLGGDTDRAAVLVTADNVSEAHRLERGLEAGVWYSYALEGSKATEERWEWNYDPVPREPRARIT